jgi:hypothetical protein
LVIAERYSALEEGRDERAALELEVRGDVGEDPARGGRCGDSRDRES